MAIREEMHHCGQLASRKCTTLLTALVQLPAAVAAIAAVVAVALLCPTVLAVAVEERHQQPRHQ
jgi:Na+/H+ antiporter NhaD/arsenite permease-like protein